MDRHRVDRTGGGGGSSDGGDRYSRFSSASFRNNNNHNDNDYPQRYPSSPPRGGGDGYMGGGGGGRYPSRNFPTGGGRNGGNGGVGGGGEGYGGYGGQLPYLSGQKRSSSEFSSPVRGGGGYYRRDSPPDSRWDSNDSGTFAKLFVGSVPRTATEDEVRPFFEQHGNVLEVALIKDKRTGQQQGCCFVKYATSKDADRAIRALHNQCTLPGGVAPIQVRYADGERERLGAVEYKLFVGSLNKHATEKEIEDIFAPYGLVEDVYIMRDEMKQSRGCGFVKYAHREMAAAAINALNGIYTMRGCDQPLIVRFADPKRPKTGDSRSGPTFGGPGFGPRSQMPPGPPPMSRPPVGRQMGSQAPSHLWPPMSPERLGPPSSLGSQRVAAGPLPPSMAGSFGLGLSGAGQSNNGSLTGPGIMPISSSQQGFNLPPLQSQPYGLQPFQYTRSLQSPPHSTSSSQLPHSLASYTQGLPTLAPIPQASLALQSSSVSYPQTSPALAPKTQVIQPLQGSLTSNQLLGQRPPLQQLPGLNAQSPMPQMQMPLVGLTPGSQLSSGSQLQVGSLSFNQPQIPSVNSQAQQIQVQQPQLLVQQASSLGLQSQTVLSQLQQQLHLVQASSQSHQPPTSQPNVQQSLWAISMPQATLSSASIASIPVASSSVATASVPSLSSQPSSPASCSWTEHTSPEGYKYYYNSLSCESRWEKPEELTMFEQKQSQQQQPQQQPPPQQQQQAPQQLQAQSQAHLPVQLQQLQSQSQQHQPLQMKFQQPALSSQGASYLHLQALGAGVGASAAAAAIDPLRLQPSVAAQEWAWKK